MQHCLDEAITTLHTVYHTTVCGVIGVAEGKGEWTPGNATDDDDHKNSSRANGSTVAVDGVNVCQNFYLIA